MSCGRRLRPRTVRRLQRAPHRGDAVRTLHPDVAWPNGWEDGYVTWASPPVSDVLDRGSGQRIDPDASFPLAINDNGAGHASSVRVHQVVRDLDWHRARRRRTRPCLRTCEDGLIRSMEIAQMTIIKNGTIVTADLTYKADVRIEDGTITEIGPEPQRRRYARRHRAATSCPAASIRTPISKCPSWAPIRPTISSPARAPRSRGGTTMVVDFCLPNPNQSLLEALQMWDNKTSKASLRLLLPHGHHLVGRAGLQRDGRGRRSRHHLVQALHGL